MPDNSVIIKSGVCLRRNYDDYLFVNRMNDAQRLNVSDRMEELLLSELVHEEYSGKEMVRLSTDYDKYQSFNQLIDEAAFKGPKENGTGCCVFIPNAEDRIHITAFCVDHVRISAIYNGAELRQAHKDACEIERCLSKNHPFAFDKNWGYLSANTSMTGNGMTGMCLLHLWGLNRSDKMEEITREAVKGAMEIKPMLDADESDNELYCLTTRIQLGKRPVDILDELQEMAERFSQREIEARRELIYDDTDAYADDTLRAIGLLQTARLMSFAELLELYSDVRAGLNESLLQGDITSLDKLVSDLSDYSIAQQYKDLSERDLELIRAEKLRRVIPKLITCKMI